MRSGGEEVCGGRVRGRGSAQRAARGRGRGGGRALCGGAPACPRRASPPRGLPRASRSRGRPPEGSRGRRGAGRAWPPPRGLRRAPALLLRRVGRGGSVEEGQLRRVRGLRPRAPEVRGAPVAGLRAEPARASPRRPPGRRRPRDRGLPTQVGTAAPGPGPSAPPWLSWAHTQPRPADSEHGEGQRHSGGGPRLPGEALRGTASLVLIPGVPVVQPLPPEPPRAQASLPR